MGGVCQAGAMDIYAIVAVSDTGIFIPSLILALFTIVKGPNAMMCHSLI